MTAPETEHGISPSSPGDRFGAVLVWIAKRHWYLFCVFALASLAAMSAWILGAAIREFLWEQWPVHIVQYVAWIAAAAFAAIGQPLGWVSVSYPQRPEPPAEAPTSVALETSVPPTNRPLVRALRTSLLFGVFGVVFGMVLGGLNAWIWLSIALSPFALREWKPEMLDGTANRTITFVLVTLIVSVSTIVVLGTLGLLLGGVGSLMGWATETPISDARKRFLQAELAEAQRLGP